MKVFRFVFVTMLLIAVVGGSAAWAGAKLKINDESEINLGFRVQALYINSDQDRDGDGTFESYDQFKVRRGRIRLGAKVNSHVSAFLQTEFTSDAGGTGGDVRLIDAFINVKHDNWTQFIMGLNMSPANRQNLTSSGGLMAIDRPGNVYKSLAWGGRALHTFSNVTYSDSDSGLRVRDAVRDLGLTFFGSGDAGENTHVKYYLGVYDGVQNAGEDSEHYTARVQVNFFDAEPGFYNLSTYLGKKKTFAIGASVDTQSDVAIDAALENVDYDYQSIDAFVEWPAGDGAITGEASFSKLDFGDAVGYESSQGDGFYVQGGYFVNNWQPWVEYETWSSDDAMDVGSYKTYRLGITRFLMGHNANIKLGYEKFKADTDIGGTMEDSIDSLVVGFYTTY